MITVSGQINVRTIPGRFGHFNVGTLDCDIGSFTVKDASIEELDEGVYDGEFVVDSIKPNSYFSGGRLVVEVRAYLHAIQLRNDTASAPAAPENLEQDPIEEIPPAAQAPLQQPVPPSVRVPSQPAKASPDEDNALADLFAELWPLAAIVKLDPSVDRAKFRQQKDYLKQSGYRFIATQQHWIKE